jgi:hypothetical protein
MALTKISASVIAANAIVAAGVAENSISTSEIATDGVGTLQISDGAVTSGKLDSNIDIAGTLDVTGVLTADSNVVIAGNLTVNGATVTNSSTNTTIADALIELGTGTTGSPANDAGIVIERGDSDNAFIGWDESADTFILGTGSFTGASTGNLTISTAPLSVGTLTASGITFPTSDGSSGQVLKTDGSGNLTFDAQTAVVDNFTATGDGSTTDFDTGINPGDEVNTWVFIDGVYQQKGEYSYSGSTISFSTAPDSGATIDVTTGTVGGFASADSVLGVYETTTTDTDTYTTGISASNENNTWVFVGGVYQPKDSYTFSSGTLTFDANTPTGQKLSVTATKSLSAGSVETNSITANAVTSAKIASNSILSRHIANNSIVGADISATTQITASTFTGALTGDVTGNVVGNLTGTIQTAAQTNITSVGTLSALTVSGQLTAGGIAYPTSDGTNEQVLRTDGSGNLSFGTISGTTLNNNTNNYVMTGTGTANTLNGESGLTYDGTTLDVTGTATMDGLVSAGTAFVNLTARPAGVPATAGALWSAQTETGNYGIVSRASSTDSFTYIGNTGSAATLGTSYGSSGSYLPLDLQTSDKKRLSIASNGDISFYEDTGTTAKLFWDASTERLGIGTSSPSKGLHLNFSNDIAAIRFQNTTNAKVWDLTPSIPDIANSGFSLYNVTDNTVPLHVDNSGNVGIGNTNPQHPLHFGDSGGYHISIGSANTTPGGNTPWLGVFNNSSIASATYGWGIYDSSADGSLQIWNRAGNTTGYNAFTIKRGGNVGINWSGSTARLGIIQSGSSTPGMNITDGSTSDFLVYAGHSSGIARIGPSTGQLAIQTAGTERMRINSSGIILVGTTSPSAGFITCMELKGTESPLSIINETATDASDRTSIGFRNAAGTMVGNVGVNNSGTVFNTTSDYRLKENVDYTFDATTRLKKLKPARFNFIAQPDNTIDGFMAHEVQDIVPEAITGVKDATETKTNAVVNSYGNYIAENITEEEWLAGKENGTYDADTTWAASHTQNIYQGIDQAKLVPLLVKTIQELEARITALES